MNDSMDDKEKAPGRTPSSGARIRIPGFVADPVGLGDLISSASKRLGIAPCGGCQRRAAVINKTIEFIPLRKHW